MTKLAAVIAAAAFAAAFTYLTSKNESRHAKDNVACQQSKITTVPWELRGYFFKYKPEQKI